MFSALEGTTLWAVQRVEKALACIRIYLKQSKKFIGPEESSYAAYCSLNYFPKQVGFGGWFQLS